jgi:hypothetical protein
VTASGTPLASQALAQERRRPASLRADTGGAAVASAIASGSPKPQAPGTRGAPGAGARQRGRGPVPRDGNTHRGPKITKHPVAPFLGRDERGGAAMDPIRDRPPRPFVATVAPVREAHPGKGRRRTGRVPQPLAAQTSFILQAAGPRRPAQPDAAAEPTVSSPRLQVGARSQIACWSD